MNKTARQTLALCKRVIIKVGTSTIMYPNGTVNLQRLDKLAFVLSDLRNQGKEVILVSSGAVGVGLHRLNLKESPKTIPEQQAVQHDPAGQTSDLYGLRNSDFGRCWRRKCSYHQ